jgi:hypothetical protein
MSKSVQEGKTPRTRREKLIEGGISVAYFIIVAALATSAKQLFGVDATLTCVFFSGLYILMIIVSW